MPKGGNRNTRNQHTFTKDGPKRPRGRPKGSKNKATPEVRELARALVDDPEYIERLKARLLAGEAGHMETLLWHYAFGKPADVVQLDGDVTITLNYDGTQE